MFFVLRLTCFIAALTIAFPVSASDDRTAGTKPATKAETQEEKTPSATETKKKPAQKVTEQNQDPNKTPVVNTPQPRTGMTMDRKAMESLGPLTNPLKGGLGIDMWAGTARSVVQEFLPQLPAGNTIRPAQLLARRVLLSNGDIGMMRNDKSPEAGQDLFTLRLEKLIEMGAYSDAVDLYTLIEGEPGHDRLAHAGIMALMHGGFPAQACLEVRAAHKDQSAQPDPDGFWPQIEAVCTFIQIQSVKAIADQSYTKISLNGLGTSPVTGVPGSKILTTLASRSDYRHAVSSPADVAELSNLERAVLKGLGRLDYTRLKIKKIYEIPGPVLMSMASDPNMPGHLRIALNVEAAGRGLIDADDLGALYIAVAKDSRDAGGLAARYAALMEAETTPEKNAIVAGVLEGKGRRLPTPLLPFAPMVSDVNPDGLSPQALETGLLLMLTSGIVPSERWLSAWLRSESGDSQKSRDQVLLYLANLLPENLPTNSTPFPDEQVKMLFTPQNSPEALRIWAVFAGLGRQDVLHNVASKNFYEKHVDLTSANDYVMPSSSLLEKLHDAAQNGRLGEVALLASVALNNDNPETTHPGTIQEVLKSLETVGLKEEARHMALGVVMSLKQ